MQDMTKQPLSRRSFAKAGGAALAGALLGAIPFGLGGCTPQADSQGGATGEAPAPALQVGGLSSDMIDEAARTLDGIVEKTPLVSAPSLGNGREVQLKLESLQRTGSFKLRGAYNMMASLDEMQRAAGAVTCSAGNHAQGVAYAAQAFNMPATIFIPADAPQEKIDATRSYGVEVRLVDGDFDQAKAEAEEFVTSVGGTYVPPFDDYRIMAGQGTVGLEILEQAGSADAVIVPVGGGGLIAGVACALKAANPNIAVYGIESDAVPGMTASLAAGEPVKVDALPSLADGIHVARPGDKTFGVVRELVDGVYTVTEDQIAQAVVHLSKREKVVVEGAGATVAAALLNDTIPLGEASSVVGLVSGGNIDAARLGGLLVA